MNGSMVSPQKPLGCKAYGSIGHLPNSRMGPADHSVHDGQFRICTEKTRDKHDVIIVQEKLDGSCTAVTKKGGKILALGRAGYLAETSPYVMHHLFAEWVKKNDMTFDYLLDDGEWVVGEWLAQAHGTIYDLKNHEPWVAFDLFSEGRRLPYFEFYRRVENAVLQCPHLLHVGGPLSVAEAMIRHEENHYPCDQVEGVVYRVERKGKVDFLAKWVRPDKVDGKYLESQTGKDPVWNWEPQ